MKAAMLKAYSLLALLAVLNLLALGGLVGYLVWAGQLNGEHLEQIAAVLRNDAKADDQDEVVTDESDEPEEVPDPDPSSNRLDRDRQVEEQFRLRMDRRRAQLNQQAATIASARLEVTRQREALERQADQLESQQRQREKVEQTEGFKKEVKLMASLKPREAIYHLLNKPKDEAASFLMALSTRKAKRIVEAAKTPGQKQAISEIMAMLRQISPADASSLSDAG